jgi:hypothetical protein
VVVLTDGVAGAEDGVKGVSGLIGASARNVLTGGYTVIMPIETCRGDIPANHDPDLLEGWE